MASSGQGSSKSVSSKSLEPLLQCSVCFEKFNSNTRSPRQLQCHHTFCLQCLTSVARNIEHCGWRRNSLTCPTCRQEHNLGLGGIQHIPTDHKIIQLMDVLSVSAEESDLCHQHRQQPLNFFCKTCKVPVCRDCTVVSHNQTKGHDVIEISEALKEFTPQFINTRDRAKITANELQIRSNTFNKAMEQLSKIEAIEEQEIRTAFARYRSQVDEREKALLSQLKGGVNRDKEEIAVLRSLVDQQVFTFRKLDEQVKETEKHQSVKQLFDLMPQIEEWEKSSTGLTNDNYRNPWYKYKSHNEGDFYKELYCLGHIKRGVGCLRKQFVTESGSPAGSDNASPRKVKRLKSHLQKMKLAQTALCDCGTGPQTPTHIIQSCPNYAQLRDTTWPQGAELKEKLWSTKLDLQPPENGGFCGGDNIKAVTKWSIRE